MSLPSHAICNTGLTNGVAEIQLNDSKPAATPGETSPGHWEVFVCSTGLPGLWPLTAGPTLRGEAGDLLERVKEESPVALLRPFRKGCILTVGRKEILVPKL